MKAIWDSDYDYRTDSIYKRPCCPECREPIGLDGSDKYRCYNCGEVVEVTDPEMLKWFEDRKAGIFPKEDKFIFDCAYCGCRFIVARKDCDYQESPYQNEGGYFFSCPCCYKSCKGRLYGGKE